MENLLVLFRGTFGMLDEYSVEDIPNETRWLHSFVSLFQLYKDDGAGTFRRTAAANFLLRLDGCPSQAQRFIIDICPNTLSDSLVAINTGHQNANPELKQILIETDLMQISTGNRLTLTGHGQMATRRRGVGPSLGVGLRLLQELWASDVLFNDYQENLNGIETDAAGSGLEIADPVRWAVRAAREHMLLDAAEHMLVALETMIDHLLSGLGQGTADAELIAKLKIVDDRHFLFQHNWGQIIEFAVASIQFGRTTRNLNEACEQVFYGSAAYEAVFACAADAFYRILDDIDP